MSNETELRDAVYAWITQLKPGAHFTMADTYHHLEKKFALEGSEKGDPSKKSPHKEAARLGVLKALGQPENSDAIIKRIGVGVYLRV